MKISLCALAAALAATNVVKADCDAHALGLLAEDVHRAALYHSRVLDYSPIIFPVLDAFNRTGADTANHTQTYHQALKRAADLADTEADFEAAIQLAFPDLHTNHLQSRNPYYPPNCGMELVITAGCRILHLCHWMCIQMPKNFPYRTCATYLVNGKCPEGLMGVGHIRPVPPGADN